MATTIIILFKLRPGVERADYERWAREVDLPEVRRLRSVDGFEVLRAAGLLSGGASPYDYCEILRVNDMTVFAQELASATLQQVAEQYRQFADAPLFIRTEAL